MSRRRTPAPEPVMDRPHHHQWQPADPDTPTVGYVCPDCPATAPACVVCGKVSPTGDRTCEACVSHARNDLRQVRDLYRQLPDMVAAIAGLHGVRYDRGGGRGGAGTTITGGAALVLSAGGYANKTRLGAHETPSSVDPSLIAAERQDPPSVLGILTFWEDNLRAERHDPAATATSVDAAATWLIDHTDWAAQTSAQWDDYRGEIRNLLWRLRRLTGDVDTPVETYVPCPYCAGRVVQLWTTTGLGDIRQCVGTKAKPGCGITWASEAHFLLAIRDAHQNLPATRPDELVTLEDAKRIYGSRIRPNLLDVWVTRGVLKAATRDDGREQRNIRGQALYRLGTIDLQITTTSSTEATA